MDVGVCVTTYICGSIFIINYFTCFSICQVLYGLADPGWTIAQRGWKEMVVVAICFELKV